MTSGSPVPDERIAVGIRASTPDEPVINAVLTGDRQRISPIAI